MEVTPDEFEALSFAEKQRLISAHQAEIEWYWRCYKCGKTHKGLLKQAKEGWCDVGTE